MSRRKKTAVWLIWIIGWPISLFVLYKSMNPAFEGNVMDIIAFIILASIVALFPLQVGENPVFFTHGIAFAVFLYHGLFIEIIVSQAALICLLVKLRVGKDHLHRIPLNFLMFLAISIASAMVYHLFGGEHGDAAVTSSSNVIPIIAYAVSQLLFNQFSIKLIARFLYNRKVKWLDKGFLWEVCSGMLVLPIGFLLYMVYVDFGVRAVFFVGIPFILISGMLMLYHNSSQVNAYLKKTSKIGHELTGNLGVRDVLDLFIERLSQLLPVDYIYIFDVDSDKHLKLIRFFDRYDQMSFQNMKVYKGEGVSGHTWLEGKSFQYSKRKQWSHLENESAPPPAESSISVPIVRNGKIVGVITIYSKQKHAFMQFQFMIITILGNYLGVAIENARHYEKTREESRRCPLTGLYNFRYFEDKLHDIFQKIQDQDPISLILLDIDFFKKVNDTYGHESGNEILCQLADRLQRTFENEGIVARYGGEEFVILLPGISNFQAYSIAERVREIITNEEFVAYQHILDHDEAVNVPITASIGVATYPNDCEEPLELIRHADRAMYMGAKQRGRDRVACYKDMKAAADS